MTTQPLHPPPGGFAAGRDAAHRLAVYVISPARRRTTGRIGLRASPGGFTTPPYGDDERVRLDVDRIVRERAGAADSLPVTTLNAAANDPNEIQLWPEHFDAAFDAEAPGGRITFGSSPGDGTSDEPYLDVLPPVAVPRDEVWNAVGFPGAVLPLSGFVDAADQRAAALAFMRGRHAVVASR